MKTNRPQICVFAGSGTPLDPAIMDAAEKLGAQIGQAGYDLVYGGGTGGVMGAVAAAAQKAGAKVFAVTLEKYMDEPQVAGAELSVVLSEAERFEYFSGFSDLAAYFVLPGGPGSLREAMQGLEKAVYENGPPVVLVKAGTYLDGIRQYFDEAVLGGMIKPAKKDCLKQWSVGDDLEKLLNTIAPAYVAKPASPKTP